MSSAAPAPPDPSQAYPAVCVIMPILNEARHLEEAVAAILSQEYAGPMEVVLALGPSKDGTDAIAQRLVQRDTRVRTVPNPTGRTPEGLNAALAASRSPIVVRVDGHGVLSPGYIATAVRVLQEREAANVGGLMAAEGVTAFERAAAAAMTSPLGVGASRFHTGGAEGPAETVYLGVFRREWLDRTGGYDPRFVRAQDWELNHRIREAGGLVWFTPRLRVSYRPRPNFRALARQYRDYGRWRRVVARQHSGTINARYLAAPTALVAVAAGTIAGFVVPAAWLIPGGYLAATTTGAALIGSDLSLRERGLLAAILPTMHMCWGWGFLTSRVSIGEPEPAGELDS